jgi:hypothetical protein
MAQSTPDADDTSGLFWPGYVDAISNLVLNLLFLVMILCLAIFVMSQNNQRQLQTVSGAASTVPLPTREEEALPPQATRLSTGGKTDVVQKRAEIEVRPSPQGAVTGAAHIKGKAISDQGVYLEVHYLEDGLELTVAAQQELREHLLPLLRAGFSEWDLVLTTDTAYASMRRSALLRILRVREALQSPDLPGLTSTSRIESGGNLSSSTVVRLYGRRQGVTPAPVSPGVNP